MPSLADLMRGRLKKLSPECEETPTTETGDLQHEIEVRTRWAGILDSEQPELVAEQVGEHEVYTCQLFSEEECTKLLAAAEEKGFGGTNYPKSYRGNLRLIAHDSSLADMVYERIKAVVPPEVRLPHDPDDVWEAYGLNPCWRLAKYHPGDRFQGHCDAAFAKEHNKDMSMFTVNVYLNDVEDGGSTRFYFGKEKEPDFSVAPKAGLCLLFRQPPGKSYYHDGEQLGSGLKYLIRSDVMYRKRVAD